MNKKLHLLLGAAVLGGVFASCSEDTGKKPEVEKGYYFAVTHTDEFGNESALSNEIFTDKVGSAPSAAAMNSSVQRRGDFTGVPSISYKTNRAAYQGTTNAQSGVVNIKFKPEMRSVIAKSQLRAVAVGSEDAMSRTGLSRVDNVAAQLGQNVRFERLFKYVPVHESKLVEMDMDLWYTVTFDASAASLGKVVSAFSALEDQEIEIVETVKNVVHIGTDKGVIELASNAIAANDKATKAMAQPMFNDPMLVKQWHYDRLLVDDKIADGGHVNLQRAWKKTAGSNAVIVAIIDEGVNPKHEDLKDAMWINKGEIPGNGIDDDNNGFIDDIYGWNFGNDSADPASKTGHGCHVAGTVGATNNNGIGVSGVAGGTGKGDGVRIMTCDILSSVMPLPNREAKAIRYAADNGAVIAQCSWGFQNPGETQESIKTAIEYFIKNAGNKTNFPDSPMVGGMMMFATGNVGGNGSLYYPAGYSTEIPNLLSVTATDAMGDRPKYATIGTWVSIAAPGGGDTGKKVVSCLWSGYGEMSGTSMATPHVSGIAALLIADQPGITPEQVREKLLSSGKNLDASSPSTIGKMGVGCVNASKYLNVENTNAPEVVGGLDFKYSDGGYKLIWTAPYDPDGDEVVKYKLVYGTKSAAEEGTQSKEYVVDGVLPQGEVVLLPIEDVPGVVLK